MLNIFKIWSVTCFTVNSIGMKVLITDTVCGTNEYGRHMIDRNRADFCIDKSINIKESKVQAPRDSFLVFRFAFSDQLH